MGDHERGAALHHSIESGVDLGFGDRIECAGRLIQDQDWRIFQQRTRDRQALTFAAGEHAAAFAGIGFEFQVTALDEVERLCALGSRAQFLVGGVGLADAQVLRNRAVEQQRFLKHHADIPAQRRECHAADVHAVDLDEARLRIERAMQQRDRGGFAGTGFSDQSEGLSRQRGERDVLNGGALAVIGERDVVEFHKAGEAAGIDGVGPVAHRWHRIEHVEELAQPRGFHEDAVDEAHDLFELLDQHGREGDEHHDFADARLTLAVQDNADHEDRQNRDGGGRTGHHHDQRPP